jgi:hypothetical protein
MWKHALLDQLRVLSGGRLNGKLQSFRHADARERAAGSIRE